MEEVHEETGRLRIESLVGADSLNQEIGALKARVAQMGPVEEENRRLREQMADTAGALEGHARVVGEKKRLQEEVARLTQGKVPWDACMRGACLIGQVAHFRDVRVLL